MKIFVDFDDVLFNTRDFMSDLIMDCATLGIDAATWRAAYNDRVSDVPGVHAPFTLETFAAALAKRTGTPASEIVTAMEAGAMQRLCSYIFPDSEAFLAHFAKEDVFVLTFGDDAFQRRRVEESGIARHVGAVFVTQAQKVDVLTEYLDAHQDIVPSDIVYLDDRPVYFTPVKQQLPSVTTVLVARPERRYQDGADTYCDHVVTNLTEAQKVIKDLHI